ncbi:MAG TPA: glycosyltransferase family 4 protein [Rhizomicrobium sp.]|jgi:glycosyltransferase involved in cell wall biosynthesis
MERVEDALANRSIRVLTFTTLYPNAGQPNHGVFVENRLRHLVASGQVQAQVIAPVPWFPSRSPIFGRYANLANVPKLEIRNGIAVAHPRYLVIPKFGMSVSPATLYASTLAHMQRYISKSDFDLIDAHYFYPDGVAAILLGRKLGKPVTITARGTDVNLIPRYAIPRRLIRLAARRAAGIIAVSEALKTALVTLGVPDSRVLVLRNGVDLNAFTPSDREAARAKIAVTGNVLLSAGHLIERKGHDLTISALPRLPRFTLLLVGDGPEKSRLQTLATRMGVADRVRFLGAVPHESMREYYSAADALVLASSREGWPNVLLESMACGTPVVASPIWGNPEVVKEPAAGVLMPARTPEGVAAAVATLFRHLPARSETRKYAERFSWHDTSLGQIRLFQEVLTEHRRKKAANSSYP